MSDSIALVDCNNFFVSCERVFNPRLNGKPVVVLSSNDGCVIARSAEAKAMGVPMGEPFFRMSGWLRRVGGVALSSNFALYADLSRRVMHLLRRYSDQQEVYSIDECFLDLAQLKPSEAEKLGRHIRNTIQHDLGLPVCVGIAPSKTLAKLANHVAKKRALYDGVCNFNAFDLPSLEVVLARMPVSEVWGVGRRLLPALGVLGIRTVLDLKRASPALMRRRFSVVVSRMVEELNGVSVLSITSVRPPKAQIMCSRSFGCAVLDVDELSEAISSHIATAAEKLRGQSCLATQVGVYLDGRPWRGDGRYAPWQTVVLDAPTDDTRCLTQAALAVLRAVYRVGFDYRKAGVCLAGMIPTDAVLPPAQGILFAEQNVAAYPVRRQGDSNLMKAVDAINQRMGRGTLRWLGEGLEQRWQPRSTRRSPAFTTRLSDIPIAQAG